jgi:hypothetical protein
MNTINEKEAQRVLTTANNTIKIIKAIREGLEANDIVQLVGCNYSVAKYYIKLLTNIKD